RSSLTLTRQAETNGSTSFRPPDVRGEGRSRSARKRPLRIDAARGLMCRELHEPSIALGPKTRKTKNRIQSNYFLHLVVHKASPQVFKRRLWRLKTSGVMGLRLWSFARRSLSYIIEARFECCLKYTFDWLV
ncbi:MAG TPA: hypothetical protein VF407_00410, partial [Polyangiaceae bacterium]